MSNEEKIISLIQEHQKRVDMAVNLFKKYLSYDLKHREWWQQGFDQEGSFGPNNKYHYFFHGNLCKISNKSISIDLDFQYPNSPASFDAHKLVNLAKQIKGYEDFANLMKVKTLLPYLLNIGLVKKRFPDQYYLV